MQFRLGNGLPSVALQPMFSQLLEAVRGKRPAVGMWLCSGSPVNAEIMAGSGIDWLLIDGEHSPLSLESIQAQLQVTAAYPVVTVVRVPWNDSVTIKQYLDLGAQNVLVPMVNTAEEAEAAVKAVRYPSEGIRGIGSALARSGRWNRIPSYLHDANERHVNLLVQVETAQAVKNASEIAAVDGIDGVFVGPSDLSASMGLLGQQTHPEVVAAVKATIAAVKDAGKPCGVNAFDSAVAADYVKSGADFLLVGADVSLLARGSEQLAAQFCS